MHPMNDFLSTAFPGMSFEFVADNAAGLSSDCSNHHHCSITPTTAAKVAPSQPRRKRSILSSPPNGLLRKHLEARWEPVTSDDDDDDDSSDDNNTQSSSRRSSAPITVSRPPAITNKARSSSDSAVQSYPEEFARSRQRRRRTDVAVSQPVRKVSDNNTPPKQRRGSGTKPKKQHPRKQLQQRSRSLVENAGLVSFRTVSFALAKTPSRERGKRISFRLPRKMRLTMTTCARARCCCAADCSCRACHHS